MADPSTRLVSDVALRIGLSALSRAGRELGYVVHYSRNIEDLKEKVEKLKTRLLGRRLEADDAKRNGDLIAPEVKHWFSDVSKLLEEVTRLLEVEVVENKGCLRGSCLNVKKYRRLSKKAKAKANVAAELESRKFEKVVHPAPRPVVGDRYIGDYKVFESRTPVINQMMELLRDDVTHIIGLCGMGGTGKTTMVNEITIRAKDEKLFDEIVMAVASQKHDLMKTQEEIARYLGLNFKETTLEGRADKLWKRLLQSTKGNLVIIDDVWANFKLKEIGIPIGGGHENCKNKVVLTSRSENVCRAIGCQKFIRIDVLTVKESWSLFVDMAGDICYDPDLYSTASEIVKKCEGLFIAIITLGKALSNRSKDVWFDTLLKLQKFIVPADITDLEDGVYRSLQVSYDLLRNKEAKKLFLLCCMYPEHETISLDDLLSYVMGLECFEGITSLIQARHKVSALTEELKGCYLLLDGNNTLSVKVHDVVRVVGNMIASRKERKVDQFNTVVVHGEKWYDSATVASCKAISVVSDEITELPLGEQCFPELNVLQFACKNFFPNALNNVFKGMKELKVLLMWGMSIPLFPSSFLLLKNLRVLVLDCDLSTEGSMTIKDLVNLVILRLRGYFEWFDMENLTNLRLLDITGCTHLSKVSIGVISGLHQLEELHVGSIRWDFGVEDVEDERRDYTSLAELDSLTHLSYLGIQVKSIKLLLGATFLGRLERYMISVGVDCRFSNSFSKRNIFLNLDNKCTDLGYGLERLLAHSIEDLFLTGDGVKLALDKIVPHGHQCLKKLTVMSCENEMVENLADYRSTTACFKVFPQLEILNVERIAHLKEIVCYDGQGLPKGSFWNLREIELYMLPALARLFKVLQATNLVLLESLCIKSCKTMEEIISNQESSSIAGNRLVFPKLCVLILEQLDSLTCFCQGIELQIPQLKVLKLVSLPKLLTFGPEDAKNGKHDNANLRSLFNNQVLFPSLVELRLDGLDNIEELWSGQFPIGQFQKLKCLEVSCCNKLLNIFPSHMQTHFPCLEYLEVVSCDSLEVLVCESQYFENLKTILVLNCPRLVKLCSVFTFKGLFNLETLVIENCQKLEVVIEEEDRENRDAQDNGSLIKLQEVTLNRLPCLKFFCNIDYDLRIPELTEFKMTGCPEMSCFSMSSVSTPKLKFLDDGSESSSRYQTNSVGDLNSCIKRKYEESKIYYRLCGSEVDNMENLLCSQLPTGCFLFQILKSLLISDCGNIVIVFPSHLQANFLCLESLHVCDCASIEVVFGCNGQQFGNLKEICIWDCPRLEKLCSASLFKGLSNLQTLELCHCEKMEEVVGMDVEEKHKGEVLSLIRLNTVVLYQLPSLKCFCNAEYALELPELTEMIIKDCPELSSISSSSISLPQLTSSRMWFEDLHSTIRDIFKENMMYYCLENSQVDNVEELWCSQLPTICFEKLKFLQLYSCDKLMNVFPSNLQIDFPNLEELHVRECNSMEIVFDNDTQNTRNLKRIKVWECPGLGKLCSISMFKGLSSLETLDIWWCEKMEVVVAEEEKEGDGKFDMSLKTVKLDHLPSLRCFFKIEYALELPELTKMIVKDCPELSAFSTSSVKTLKLRSVDESEQYGPWEPVLLGDLNETIKQMFINGKERYSLLDSEVDNVEELLCRQLPTGCFHFQILKSLVISDCENIVNLFPSELQIHFPCLGYLRVCDCGSMEVAFGCKGQQFENLKEICVWGCPCLKRLCSAAVFKHLLNLQTLELCNCEEMEEVVGEQEKEDGALDTRVVSLTRLQTVVLYELPSLKCFCNVDYALELPELMEMVIKDCPELSTISSSSINMPKLTSSTLWFEDLLM